MTDLESSALIQNTPKIISHFVKKDVAMASSLELEFSVTTEMQMITMGEILVVTKILHMNVVAELQPLPLFAGLKHVEMGLATPLLLLSVMMETQPRVMAVLQLAKSSSTTDEFILQSTRSKSETESERLEIHVETEESIS